MNENYEGDELDNIVILNDEDGNEVKFEFLDLIDLDDEEYVVLLPITEDGEEDEGEVVILKVEDNDDEDSEEESYVSVSVLATRIKSIVLVFVCAICTILKYSKKNLKMILIL